MARYRTKDPVDLAWNKIRRGITADVDRIIRDVREEVINTLLGAAFEKFSAGLSKGQVLELEPGDEQFIREKVQAVLATGLAGITDDQAA